jgi:Na+-driven multidrug efflux pump
MLLLAGTFGNDNLAAAQTLVVAFGDFIMMIPYGLSLGVVTLVGNSLGSNHPGASKTRFRIATVFSTCLAAVVCILLIFLRTYIVSMYTKN